MRVWLWRMVLYIQVSVFRSRKSKHEMLLMSRIKPLKRENKMLSMRISDVIAQIIEHELVQKERVKDEAVYLNFDLRMYAHVKNNPYSSSCGFHLLYHSLSNYVSVFSGITSSPFGKLEEVKEWRHEVSHDFEWRRPPIFSEVYFELAA